LTRNAWLDLASLGQLLAVHFVRDQKAKSRRRTLNPTRGPVVALARDDPVGESPLSDEPEGVRYARVQVRALDDAESLCRKCVDPREEAVVVGFLLVGHHGPQSPPQSSWQTGNHHAAVGKRSVTGLFARCERSSV